MSAIESYMTKQMVTASPDETVAAVAKRMSDAEVGAVVVVDGGELAGIFSERDLLQRVVAEGLDPSETPVGSVATPDVATVAPDSTIRICAQTLRDQGIRHLPVVDGRKPVGVISARDFFGDIAVQLEDWIEQARYDEQLRNAEDPYDHIGGGYGR